jgi:hypothetical protein
MNRPSKIFMRGSGHFAGLALTMWALVASAAETSSDATKGTDPAAWPMFRGSPGLLGFQARGYLTN